ncbi:MAG: hypothetical protein ABH826_02655 [Patescibacteria group bacterium]|nr:hypothetical protein [Patescibacteria group bacterium]
MHKTNRVWDVLVLWPFIYLILAIIFTVVISFITTDASIPEEVMGALVALGSLFFLIHITSIVLMIVVYIYAIHRLYTQTRLPDDEKKKWLILIILFNFIAIPFLHFMYLRK